METVYAMKILVAILGVAEFVFCLWGSILCCASRGCCAPTQPTVYVVSRCLQCICSMNGHETWEPLSLAFSARIGIFSARSAGSSRKLRLNSNHAPKVNARPYWAYNRPIMPMYEHLCCHLRRGLIICLSTADNRLTIDQCTMTQDSIEC